MKCQIPVSMKNKKNIISLLSAEFAHSMVRDKHTTMGKEKVYLLYK